MDNKTFIPGSIVKLDVKFNNTSLVKVISQTTNKLFTRVCNQVGYDVIPASEYSEWDVMTIRLTPHEYILCAANYYNDGIKHVHRPINIHEGFITCGRRHHNCIGTFVLIVGFPYNNKAKELHATEIQGFLTNTNRFVDRKDAYNIAFNANQIIGPNKGDRENTIGLTSEDLY